jgi:acetyl-CoA carboxylase biotin carboxyl carrier protein
MPSKLMDLQKIKTLIDFVGRSDITELSVTERGVTVRILRSRMQESADAAAPPVAAVGMPLAATAASPQDAPAIIVKAPLFGILHRAAGPGQAPFVRIGDRVDAGQTLFIIEAMKVFNAIAAPAAGRVVSLVEVDGDEVEIDAILAEIA